MKTRWRDVLANRGVDSVRVGSPTWSTGVGGGITNIVVASNVATVNFTAAHGLTYGMRLVLTGSPTDAQLKKDNYLVHSVPSATQVVFYTRNVSNNTYTAGITLTQNLDPMESTTVCRYTSANHAFMKGDTVVVSDVNGITGCNGTFTVIGVSQDEFTVNASGTGTGSGGNTLQTIQRRHSRRSGNISGPNDRSGHGRLFRLTLS